jgi:hypothetical protein
LIPFLKNLHARFGRGVRYIRCDNAGENIALQRECEKAGLGIQFEFTAPGTPQQNGRVERKFATLWGRVRAMMEGAQLSKAQRRVMWSEAANTATDFETYFPVLGDSHGSASKFFGKGYKSIVDSPKIFGEACIITKHEKIKAKLADRGKLCMWMGYAKDHKAGTYRIYNPTTRKLFLSRDVTFLRKSMKDHKSQMLENRRRIFKTQLSSDSDVSDSDDEDDDIPNLVTDDESDSSEDEDEESLDPPGPNLVGTGSNPDQDNADDIIARRVSENLRGELRRSNPNTLDPKVIRALKQLEGSFFQSRSY